MEIKINIKDKEDLIIKYSDLWSKFLGLSKREQELYVLVLKKYTKMIEDGVKEPYISQLIFGTESMRETRDKMGLTHQNFNNLKMSLKKKKVILDNDGYMLNPIVTVNKELNFKFV